jgi:nitroimidazol reductase NimA-like FMN-containing flavoprotein (pyridoxamine 5'-phosphate oxidase superfamily)
MGWKNPSVSLKEMEEILKKETMGFLGMSMNDAPYVVPLTYGYARGRILMHCALKGKKLEHIRANPRVCFTVGTQSGKTVPHPQGVGCPADNDSVICYGTARILENMDERLKALNDFNHCLNPEAEDMPPEAISKCLALEIRISNMTGRLQRKGGEYTYFEYDFAEPRQSTPA